MQDRADIKQNLSYISSWPQVLDGFIRLFTRKSDTCLQSLQSAFGNESYTKYFFMELNSLVLADVALSVANQEHNDAKKSYDDATKTYNKSSYFSEMKSYLKLKRAEFALGGKAKVLRKAEKALHLVKENFALEKLKCTDNKDAVESAAVLKSSGSFMALSRLRNALLKKLKAPADFYTDEILKTYAACKVMDVANVMLDLNIAKGNSVPASGDKENKNYITPELGAFLNAKQETYKNNSKNQWRLAVRVSKDISKKLTAEIKSCDYHILCKKVKDAKNRAGEAQGLRYISCKLSYAWHAMWKLCYTKIEAIEDVDYIARKVECKGKLVAIQNSRPLFLFPWLDYQEAKDAFVRNVQEGVSYVKEFGGDAKSLTTTLEQETYDLLVAKVVPNLQKGVDGTSDEEQENSEEEEADSESDVAEISEGKDDNQEEEVDLQANLNSSLITAASKNNAEEVQQLLAKGADVKAKDSSGKIAVEYAKDEKVKILLRAKACSELAYAAVTSNATEIKKMLLKNHDAEEKDLNNALKYGVLAGNEGTTIALLNAGADANAKLKHGRTLLMWAAHKDYALIVTLLLSMGADVKVQDEQGKTVSFYAKSEKVKQLLKSHSKSQKDNLCINEAVVNSSGAAMFSPAKSLVAREDSSTPSSVVPGPGITL